MDTFDAIYQRRAVKHDDSEHEFTDDEIKQLMEAAVQSPTSFNIQNWRFVLVRDKELRQRIRAAANDHLPTFYDCLMDKPHWAKYRQAQLASVDGEILEIGVGTGLNLPHYPEHVKRIITADPNPGMTQRASVPSTPTRI